MRGDPRQSWTSHLGQKISFCSSSRRQMTGELFEAPWSVKRHLLVLQPLEAGRSTVELDFQIPMVSLLGPSSWAPDGQNDSLEWRNYRQKDWKSVGGGGDA
ncbi:hypothetical protein ACSBR2_001827 [Camellia fascicularis]